MSTSALQPMCCWFNWPAGADDGQMNIDDNYLSQDPYLMIYSYDGLCIIASLMSLAGATFQLLPRKPKVIPRCNEELQSFYKQNRIVCWLAFVDLLASLGILVRSCIWISGSIPWLDRNYGTTLQNFSHISCAVLTAWIQFFYICTYFWTMSYALHQYRTVHNKDSPLWFYHLISWAFPMLSCSIALSLIYTPSFTSCEYNEWKLELAYLASSIPILVVMIMNPVLYYLISKTVDSNIRGSGMYTDQERLYAKTLRSKFFSIILVFFVCWSPNLLNGLFLFLGTKTVPLDYYIALWNYMALVNPLQAFLNSILYRNVGGCWSYSSVIDTRYKPHSSTTGQINFSGFEESSEESPLLSFR